MEQGRLPEEVDRMDICAYIQALKWRAWDRYEEKPEQEENRQKYIDDFC